MAAVGGLPPGTAKGLALTYLRPKLPEVDAELGIGEVANDNCATFELERLLWKGGKGRWIEATDVPETTRRPVVVKVLLLSVTVAACR